MQNVVEILHNLVRQRGQGEKNPLLLLHTLPSRPGSVISHLPMDQRLIHAWVRLTGSPFCQHQSLSLASLRRGEPVVLVGSQATARQTLHLLLLEIVGSEPDATALLLLPSEEAVAIHLAWLDHLNTQLGDPLTITYAGLDKLPREATHANVVLTTPDALHQRLIRHHDRAWKHLWSQLRMFILCDLDQYYGVATAHLSALLLRIARLVSQPPYLAANIAHATEVESSLIELIGQPWTFVSVNDTPRKETTLALWHSEKGRLLEAAKLATRYQGHGYQVHVTCDQLEIPLLLSLMGTQGTNVSVGTVPHEAQVHIFAGYPDSYATVYQSLEGSFEKVPQLTLLVLGNLPIERTIARINHQTMQVEEPIPLLSMPYPSWLAPPTNAYISSQHLLCAASERLLFEKEIVAWQAEDMVARLERRKELVRLPGTEHTWQPLQSIGDPYEGFAMNTAGSSPIQVFNEQGMMIGSLDSSSMDRWAFKGAALPPGRSGYRVVGRDEEDATITVRSDQEWRRTFPLRYCEVMPREERQQYDMGEHTISWGRVVVEEEVYGYREIKGESKVVDQALAPTLNARWTAPALWLELPMRLKATGQMVGWSLAWALPLGVFGQFTDLVPAYDAGLHRLYLIDAQPGGNGFSAWAAQHFALLLPLAYDIALDCRSDALVEPIARNDMDWLLTLLGGRVEMDDIEEPAPAPATKSTPTPTTPQKEVPSLAAYPSVSTASQVAQIWQKPSAVSPPHAPTPDPPESIEIPVSGKKPAKHEQSQQQLPYESTAKHRATPPPEKQDASPPPEKQKSKPAPLAKTQTPETRQVPQWGPPTRSLSAPAFGKKDSSQKHEDTETDHERTKQADQTDHADHAERTEWTERRAKHVSPRYGEGESGQERSGGVEEDASDATRKPRIHRGKKKADDDLIAFEEDEVVEPPRSSRKRTKKATASSRRSSSEKEQEQAQSSARGGRKTSKGKQSRNQSDEPSGSTQKKTTPTASPPEERRITLSEPETSATAKEEQSEDALFDVSPDADAILGKLQRLREKQRENSPKQQPKKRQPLSSQSESVPLHFRAGDRIFCLPYGEGVVSTSRYEDGQEVLSVVFPDHGRIDIHPSVSVVRRMDDGEGE